MIATTQKMLADNAEGYLEEGKDAEYDYSMSNARYAVVVKFRSRSGGFCIILPLTRELGGRVDDKKFAFG